LIYNFKVYKFAVKKLLYAGNFYKKNMQKDSIFYKMEMNCYGDELLKM